MKQFLTILKFELEGYLKNKVFVGITLGVVVLVGIGLSFPRIQEALNLNDKEEDVIEGTMYVVDDVSPESTLALLQSGLTNMEIKIVDMNESQLKEAVDKEECDSAIIIESPIKYTYISKNIGMYDVTNNVIDSLLLTNYQQNLLVQNNISDEALADFYTTTIDSSIVDLGKDQSQTFFYTYFVLFLLYVAIMMYGILVATSVASEKNSRAMEMLITSANSMSLMFGKILGSGIAGLLQLIVILGSVVGFYQLNSSYWSDNEVMKSLFMLPADLVGYTIIFFILGFFVYAFLYGAVGSWASKVEDINTSTLPIQVIYMVAFFVVVSQIFSGSVDGTLLKIASYVPFSAPMAMVVRIGMGTVALWEIGLSVLILIATNSILGIGCAKIYRVGVLLYGNTPKIGAILKAMKHK